MMVAPAAGLSRSLRSLALASLGDSPAVRRECGNEVRGGVGPVVLACVFGILPWIRQPGASDEPPAAGVRGGRAW
jgi:hypothetical protein